MNFFPLNGNSSKIAALTCLIVQLPFFYFCFWRNDQKYGPMDLGVHIANSGFGIVQSNPMLPFFRPKHLFQQHRLATRTLWNAAMPFCGPTLCFNLN